MTSLRWTTLVGAAAVLLLGGCTGSSTTGPSLDASQAASLAAEGAPGAVPTPSGSASAHATKTTAKGFIDASASKTCKPDAFRGHVALVRGAVDTYLTKPAAKGTLDRAAAARAATFAADELTAAARSITACPTTKSLHSVSLQTVDVLTATAKSLRGNGSVTQKVGASSAMVANVVSQAHRLKLDADPKKPTAAQLAG